MSAPTIDAGQSFDVSEDASVGTSVGTVSASDPDGDPLSYSITGGNEAGHFAIDANTGEITTTGELDYETTASYSLTVEVSDGTESASETVAIDVSDVVENQAPTIDAGQSFDVSEDASVGTSVGTVSASDPDGDPLSYSITGGNEAGQFAIDANTGEITTTGELDYETTASYSLTVEVSDGTESASETVAIDVSDVIENQAPTIDSGQSFPVSEDASVGTSVGTVSASDPDGDPLSYSITGGNEAGHFAIDANTGEITTTGELDYETTASYSLTVEVSDETESASETVAIDVSDVVENQAPTIDSGQSFPVSEDASVGTSVGTVSASDPDGDPLSYSITGGNEAGHFAIDANTGEITTTGELDYETTASYSLTVEVSDGTESASETVAIDVSDVVENQAPTIDAGQSFDVSEDSSVGTSVGTVSASDPDGDPLSYSITGGNEAGHFAIDANTGEITTTGELDYETTASYSLTVEVSDGTESASETVAIDVSDVVENQAPTIDAGQSFDVSEDSSVGTSVGTVSASDPDGDPLSYSITGGNEAGHFAIDANTGEITTTGELDYETTASYSLTVEVSDGTESASETVAIDVSDVVENQAPTITSFDYDVVYGDVWSFYGYVDDENPEGVTVNFGGILEGLSTTTAADGYFSILSVVVEETYSIASAVATDDQGEVSNEAQIGILPNT